MRSGMMMSGGDLARFLGSGGGEEQEKPRMPLPEVMVEMLRDVAALATAPCPYAVNDLVTMRKYSGASSFTIGAPHIVLEVIPNGSGPEVCMNARGPSRANVRIAYVDPDHDVMEVWVEHWRLEPWTEQAVS